MVVPSLAEIFSIVV